MKNKNLNREERVKRVIARGENSNHCHVVTGDVDVFEKNGETFITVGEDSNAILKHLLEKEWLDGNEVWTQEHKDIPLQKGTYKFIQQVEFDPYSELIRQVRD
jgi:hypothetical protein